MASFSSNGAAHERISVADLVLLSESMLQMT